MNKRAILYARVSGDDRQNSTSSIQGKYTRGNWARAHAQQLPEQSAQPETPSNENM